MNCWQRWWRSLVAMVRTQQQRDASSNALSVQPHPCHQVRSELWAGRMRSRRAAPESREGEDRSDRAVASAGIGHAGARPSRTPLIRTAISMRAGLFIQGPHTGGSSTPFLLSPSLSLHLSGRSLFISLSRAHPAPFPRSGLLCDARDEPDLSYTHSIHPS